MPLSQNYDEMLRLRGSGPRCRVPSLPRMSMKC